MYSWPVSARLALITRLMFNNKVKVIVLLLVWAVVQWAWPLGKGFFKILQGNKHTYLHLQRCVGKRECMNTALSVAGLEHGRTVPECGRGILHHPFALCNNNKHIIHWMKIHRCSIRPFPSLITTAGRALNKSPVTFRKQLEKTFPARCMCESRKQVQRVRSGLRRLRRENKVGNNMFLRGPRWRAVRPPRTGPAEKLCARLLTVSSSSCCCRCRAVLLEETCSSWCCSSPMMAVWPAMTACSCSFSRCTVCSSSCLRCSISPTRFSRKLRRKGAGGHLGLRKGSDVMCRVSVGWSTSSGKVPGAAQMSGVYLLGLLGRDALNPYVLLNDMGLNLQSSALDKSICKMMGFHCVFSEKP